jgi:ribose 1,5-bisphosphokinase PhnN
MKRTLAILALSAAVLGATLAPEPATADEQLVCLSKSDQRAAISNGQAVPLAMAMHSVRSVRTAKRSRGSREVIKARLCREAKGLVYVLTVLSGDGKVTHTSVDATSGKVVDAR